MYKNPNKFYSTQNTNLLYAYIGKNGSIFKINYIKIILFSSKYLKQHKLQYSVKNMNLPTWHMIK